MLDITVIILTYNESLHILRCIKNAKLFAKRIVVVDSLSQDDTVGICRSNGVEVLQHAWPGNQATQFNWALENIEIDTEWILRLDADEYLMPELVDELNRKIPTLPKDVTGVEFRLRHIFLDRWMRHGVYPVILLRLFRKGCGRNENRIMDEHITLAYGHSIVTEHDFCNHSLINLSDYCHKHVNYAVREAAMVLDEEYGLSEGSEALRLGNQAEAKHKTKSRYNKLPLFWRSFAYFLYRYFVRGGCLDGKEGFLFSFIQGWWYRTLVDAKIFEIKRVTGGDKELIRKHLKEHYGISL